MSTQVQEVKTRVGFGGKTENFKDKSEQAFEKKHLKAYLKGQKYFYHGKDLRGKDIRHEVKVIYKTENK